MLNLKRSPCYEIHLSPRMQYITLNHDHVTDNRRGPNRITRWAVVVGSPGADVHGATAVLTRER